MNRSLVLLFAFAACQPKAEGPKTSHSLAFEAMPVWRVQFDLPPKGGFTPAKAALGKKLFFDPRLSATGKMSCESCHQHERGWTDGVPLSTKFDGSKNTRNTPTLYNLQWHSHLYWDGRAPSLEENIEAAWKGNMGGSAKVVATINAVPGYQREFQAAFGVDASMTNIAAALAMFVRTLRSGGSAYDRNALSADAAAGAKVFERIGCTACHTPPLFTDYVFHNAGVGDPADVGRGKYAPSMKGAFKTPTLRNVAKTAPYFHDGSAKTLAEAVRLMVDGGKANPNLDPLLTKKSISDQEFAQLIAFLESLSSEETFTRPELPK